MAKHSQMRFNGGTRINITHYGDEIMEMTRNTIRDYLAPVFADMEADAKNLCPVGEKAKATPMYRRRKIYLTDATTGKMMKKPRRGRRQTVERIRTWGSRRGYIYKRDYKNTVERRIGKKWESREPGRLRDSIKSAVHIRKDNTAVIGFLEAGGEDAFYAGFVEMGTYKMSPRPFLRPAFNRNKAAAVAAISKAVGGT